MNSEREIGVYVEQELEGPAYSALLTKACSFQIAFCTHLPIELFEQLTTTSAQFLFIRFDGKNDRLIQYISTIHYQAPWIKMIICSHFNSGQEIKSILNTSVRAIIPCAYRISRMSIMLNKLSTQGFDYDMLLESFPELKSDVSDLINRLPCLTRTEYLIMLLLANGYSQKISPIVCKSVTERSSIS